MSCAAWVTFLQRKWGPTGRIPTSRVHHVDIFAATSIQFHRLLPNGLLMSDIKSQSPSLLPPATKRSQEIEAPELSIEKTAVMEQPKDLSPKEPALPGGGYNPYDRSTVKPVVQVARKPAVAQSRATARLLPDRD